jgi:predicted DsbA family dithiol-disulfide isomerase
VYKRQVQHAVKGALLAAYFNEGADIGLADTLAAVAATAGLPASETLTMLDSDEGRAEVLAEDSMARNAGINGVPSFIMGRHILFSGAQPAEAMAETFTRAYAILSRNAA